MIRQLALVVALLLTPLAAASEEPAAAEASTEPAAAEAPAAEPGAAPGQPRKLTPEEVKERRRRAKEAWAAQERERKRKQQEEMRKKFEARRKPQPPITDLEPTDPDEMFQLAVAYMFGNRGVEQSGEKALSWFRKCADAGHVRCQMQVGMAYWKGEIVPRDRDKALRWLRIAAENRHPRAMLELGIAYRDGVGVKRDDVEAAMWFLVAQEHGGVATQVLAPQQLKRLDKAEREEARERARRWMAHHGKNPPLYPLPVRASANDSAPTNGNDSDAAGGSSGVTGGSSGVTGGSSGVTGESGGEASGAVGEGAGAEPGGAGA